MATSSRRRCLIEPNVLCYICGEYTLEHRKTISDFIKRTYLAYFKVMLGNQDKPWTLLIVCKPCVENLRQWTNKSRKSLEFAMVWREPKDHGNNCYFCAVKTKAINRKNRNSLTYWYTSFIIILIMTIWFIPVKSNLKFYYEIIIAWPVKRYSRIVWRNFY